MEWFGTRIEYALAAVMHLARYSDDENPVKLDDIVAQTGAPPKYLVHVLLRLKERALVNSKRGPYGGYWLVKPAYMMSVAEIVSAVEQEPEEPRTPTVKDEGAALAMKKVWKELEEKRREEMRKISVEELLNRADGEKESQA